MLSENTSIWTATIIILIMFTIAFCIAFVYVFFLIKEFIKFVEFNRAANELQAHVFWTTSNEAKEVRKKYYKFRKYCDDINKLLYNLRYVVFLLSVVSMILFLGAYFFEEGLFYKMMNIFFKGYGISIVMPFIIFWGSKLLKAVFNDWIREGKLLLKKKFVSKELVYIGRFHNIKFAIIKDEEEFMVHKYEKQLLSFLTHKKKVEELDSDELKVIKQNIKICKILIDDYATNKKIQIKKDEKKELERPL